MELFHNLPEKIQFKFNHLFFFDYVNCLYLSNFVFESNKNLTIFLQNIHNQQFFSSCFNIINLMKTHPLVKSNQMKSNENFQSNTHFQ